VRDVVYSFGTLPSWAEVYCPGKQPGRAACVCWYVKANAGVSRGPSAARDERFDGFDGFDGFGGRADARQGVTALYEAHALGMIRLAVVMLGDRAAAEDVVQDAFCGLYRHWHTLTDTGKALSYLRSSVINGCRSALRRRVKQFAGFAGDLAEGSAEAAALVSEEHRQVLAAIRRLPDRQREALVLRYYLDLDEAEIARSMRISRGTVKSTTSRALTALGRILGEQS
jgi:RNA polymerase sigma-70 factor (sigma-E family)